MCNRLPKLSGRCVSPTSLQLIIMQFTYIFPCCSLFSKSHVLYFAGNSIVSLHLHSFDAITKPPTFSIIMIQAWSPILALITNHYDVSKTILKCIESRRKISLRIAHTYAVLNAFSWFYIGNDVIAFQRDSTKCSSIVRR